MYNTVTATAWLMDGQNCSIAFARWLLKLLESEEQDYPRLLERIFSTNNYFHHDVQVFASLMTIGACLDEEELEKWFSAVTVSLEVGDKTTHTERFQYILLGVLDAIPMMDGLNVSAKTIGRFVSGLALDLRQLDSPEQQTLGKMIDKKLDLLKELFDRSIFLPIMVEIIRQAAAGFTANSELSSTREEDNVVTSNGIGYIFLKSVEYKCFGLLTHRQRAEIFIGSSF